MSLQRITKYPSYREAIEYVALNDEPTLLEEDDINSQPTVHLINVIFGTPLDVVVADVIRYRKRDWR